MVIGVILLVSSHAATPYASTESENGSLSGVASLQSSSAASGGSYVTFGSASSGPGNILGVPAGITPGAIYENAFTSMSASQQAAVIQQMKADGVKWLRLDAPSVFTFDTLISDAENAGINVDAVIQNWNTATTPSAMGSFATQAVNHYKPKGVETYEVLNEPNGCAEPMSASDYTALLKSVYTAIKTADSQARVLTAGMCPAGGSNEPYTYLQAMYTAGAQGYFDAFNDHPYSAPDTPLQTGDSWNPWSYLAQLHSIMQANGDGNKQIWLTEFGCPTGTDGGYTAYCTDSTEATQITDAFTSARQQSWLGPLLIYDWQDDSEGDWGIYNSNGTAKASVLSAYTSAANQ